MKNILKFGTHSYLTSWVLIILFQAADLHASDLLAADRQGMDDVVIHGITIEGLHRTREEVIRRELLFEAGEWVSGINIQESLQRLRNLQIFAEVQFDFRSVPGHPFVRNLAIVVKERWTLIPFLKYVNRDAEQVLAVGLNDINFLGRFVDLGLYFETFNGAPSISVSYRDPRFLNQRMSVGGSIGHLIHNRTVYEEGGQELGSFSVVRQSLRSYVSKEWKKDLSAGLFLDLNHLYYSEDFLSASDRQNNNNQAYLLPQNSEAHLIGATAELGRLNYETEMIEGQLTTTRLAFAHPAWGATEAFYVFDTSYLWFAKMANQANLGFRVGLSVTDSRDAEFQIYRGGNNWVRGLIPGLYRGQLALQINSEYRLSSFRRPWLIFQNVVFFDAGLAADDLAQVFSDQRHTAAAAGLGLRILSPKVYRLNLRLDYTALSSASAYEQISLGFEQFF